MQTDDTIAAISSAVGPSARMIVRTSGADSLAIAAHLSPARDGEISRVARVTLVFDGIPVPATLYTFIGPHSVTGEDVVEYHIPGNPLLARLLLDELIRCGARQADPGDFTARAYFNGRIDLTAAEGVAATVAAASERELLAARQLLSGGLARRLRPIMERIAEALALVEAGIDFSDEDVSFISREDALERIDKSVADLESLLAQSTRFERLTHEPEVVLVGRPNAGKSTLLNALAGHERAVISPVAGTTRDAIWAHVRLRRGIARVIDVAGIATAPESELELKMRDAALRATETADVVVLVRDATDARPAPQLPRSHDLLVLSKSDRAHFADPNADALPVSSLTGASLDALRAKLDLLCFGEMGNEAGNASLALNARHVDGVNEALHALRRAAASVDGGAELLALELRESLDALGRILGGVTPDDLLGRIFATFCIGK
jgi:tRNA modification GTPase